MGLHAVDVCGRKTKDSDEVVSAVPVAVDGGTVGTAQAAPPCDMRLKHGFKIEGRAADDFQHVAAAVCWSSAAASSAVRACTSSNSRTFSIAITA